MKILRTAKWISLLLPFQFAVDSILAIYIGEPSARVYIAPEKLFPLAAGIGILSICITGLVLLLSHDIYLSAIYSSLAILSFFFIWKVFLVILVAAALGWFLLRWLIKADAILGIVLILESISGAALAFYLVQAIPVFQLRPVSNPGNVPEIRAAVGDGSEFPDIYYIILDGYGRADVLSSIHGFDNSEFIHALESRGFRIPAQSQANYPRSLLSLASSLNLDYLSSYDLDGDSRNYWWRLTPVIQHSRLRGLLEDYGYQTYFFASGWDFTDIRDGDHYLRPFPVMLDDFSRAYIEMTNLRLFVPGDSKYVSFPSFDTHRRLITYQFETLPRIASLPGPRFVFAHIINPHPPFVFDENGTAIDPDYPYSLSYARGLFGDTASYRASYLAQLTYDNHLTLQMIDQLLENSKTPPIIIIQGDHGPGIYSDFSALENTCLLERFSILNAYYLPGYSGSIPDDISPVNTFRLILKEYLDLEFPPLQERRYFSIDESFFEFTDVTSLTELPCLGIDGQE